MRNRSAAENSDNDFEESGVSDLAACPHCAVAYSMLRYSAPSLPDPEPQNAQWPNCTTCWNKAGSNPTASLLEGSVAALPSSYPVRTNPSGKPPRGCNCASQVRNSYQNFRVEHRPERNLW